MNLGPKIDLATQVFGVLSGRNGGTGGSGGTTFTLVAGENISSYHAVVCLGGLAYNADASVLSHAGRVIGVAVTSALSGALISIQNDGEAENAGFAFNAGDPIFLGNAGALVQAPSGSGFEQQLGMALSPSRFLISMEEVILYA